MLALFNINSFKNQINLKLVKSNFLNSIDDNSKIVLNLIYIFRQCTVSQK